MCNKITIVLLLAAVTNVLSQSTIEKWDAAESYSDGGVVIHNGVRYITTEPNQSDVPGVPVYETLPSDVPLDLNTWDRMLPPKKLQTRARLYGPAHRDVRDLYKDDNIVKKAAKMAGFPLDDVVRTGESCESKVVGTQLHGAWDEFLVTGVGGNKFTYTDNRYYLNYQHIVDSCQDLIDNDIDRYRRGERINAVYDRVFTKTSGDKEKVAEQIIHNIGDACAPFQHAFDTYLPGDITVIISEDLATELGIPIDNDGKYRMERDFERIGERRTYTLVNTNDERIALLDTKITGTIQETIAEYAALVEPDFIIAKEEWVTKEAADINYSGDVKNLLMGDPINGKSINGVLKNTIAMGRNVLVDYFLSTKGLENVHVSGPSVIGGASSAVYECFATAKDPDAVRLVKKGDDSYSIEYDYELQSTAHPMTFKWFVPGTTGAAERQEVGVLQTFKFSVTSTSAAVRNGDGFIIGGTVDISPDGSAEEFTVPVVNGNISITARIMDDEYSIRYHSEDDPVSSDWEERTLTVSLWDRAPYAKFVPSKEGDQNVYLALKNSETPFEAYTQENDLVVYSGFANELCYNDIVIDGFKLSRDADGHVSDQIQYNFYDLENDYDPEDDTKADIVDFGWEQSAVCLQGVNQDIKIEDGSQNILEERIMLQSSFSLSSVVPTDGNSGTVKANYSGDFVNSTWNNADSPESDALSFDLVPDANYTFHAFVKDNEGNISSQMQEIPLLAPPVIDAVSLELLDITTGATATTFTGNTQLILSVTAHDPDNEETTRDIHSVQWGIRPLGDNSKITLDGTAWTESFQNNAFTYRELIDWEYLPGEVYEVFAKVTDDDAAVTGLGDGDGYGVTITKVGEFTLAEPLAGDVNLDGVVDSQDEAIITNVLAENPNGAMPEGLQYITVSTYLSNWIYGDLNSDNSVNADDLTIVQNNKTN